MASQPSLLARADFAPIDVPRVVGLVRAFFQLAFAFAPLAFGALREWGASGRADQTGGAPLLFAVAAAIQLAAALVFLVDGGPARLSLRCH